MQTILSKLLSRLEAKEIIREWARCITKNQDPAVFANLYLEIMRDSKNDSLRKDAGMFLMFASSRNWGEIMDELKSKVDKKTLKALAAPSAELFYDVWKGMVLSQVTDYFRGALKDAKKGKRKTG